MAVQIAQLSCGTEYSGVQPEIERAAERVGAEIVLPEVDIDIVEEACEEVGYTPKSANLKVLLARAYALANGYAEADAAIILTCFRCAEGALVRSEARRYLQENTDLPVVTYSFTEDLDASELLTRMEALVTIVERKGLLARKRQEGLTLGIDSGSTTTKAVVMEDDEVIGTGWVRTTKVVESAEKAVERALEEAGYELDDIEAIGVTGYGRYTLGRHFDADLVQEELTVNSKGTVYLGDKQEGGATVIDVGGMDNKAITVWDGIPDNFTMGGVCAGASGRFLEVAADRIGVDLDKFGKLALEGDPEAVRLDSYCIVFGIQDLVTALAEGADPEDAAAAACRSVAEQIYEQQLQEIDIREPVFFVGGTSLVDGMVKALEDVIGVEVVVPEYPQYIGAVGAALLASNYV
ncbi:methanogenesis marker 15 protein [Methanopyrus kandleri]|uniref:Activator of 2-hydroxyglutaryl-CoA dehydratase (HSP70-class ATPase domain) n=2 Tax=Methanopyrus kandleri TaxID=2320 RepID=Q8TXT0_METKA|nr:methanogenesis marker 15 protein [Methanopyrus kandleri]AAM01795.1 Activator of 2-hydroxyglutaryl-CoA dehydratase (HSP70-class ATPase domain) [Methanopyrus kandleri AV19]HII70199.1 methanogenesis marker 15 protein [Methanopyrus kandleri]